jgi:hypothetical protein
MKLRSILATTAFSLSTLLMSNTLNARESGYRIAREPQTCPSKSQPTRGAISAKQAKMYFTCDSEGILDAGSIRVVTTISDLQIQVAPRSRQATQADILRAANNYKQPISLNTDRPVYDIRGSFKQYTCNPRLQFCDLYVFPAAQGICYQNSFNDWYCTMQGTAKIYKNVASPQ